MEVLNPQKMGEITKKKEEGFTWVTMESTDCTFVDTQAKGPHLYVTLSHRGTGKHVLGRESLVSKIAVSSFCVKFVPKFTQKNQPKGQKMYILRRSTFVFHFRDCWRKSATWSNNPCCNPLFGAFSWENGHPGCSCKLITIGTAQISIRIFG